MTGVIRDSGRLSVGTLTVLPVAPPGVVDRRVAGGAMLLAPLVGALLAVPSGLLLWLLGAAPAGPWGVPAGGPQPLLATSLTIGLLALLTRGLHLDGLADTADGLGSRRPAAEALEVMRRGDVGPFGVVSLVLALLVQVAALASLVGTGLGPAALLLALVVSRLALPLACSSGIPGARSDGLGRTVAGSVGRGRLVAATLLAVVAVVLPGVLLLGTHVLTGAVVLRAGLTAAAALGAAMLLVRRCVRRLGGMTGDVLGAAVEVSFTVTLVVLTLLV
jgi:adenosylcobinamide-GDP ribazoletransferase